MVDLSSVRAGRAQAADLQTTIVSAEDLQKLPPCFAAYSWAQNQLSVVAEQLLDLPELNRFAPVLEKSDTLYTPEGPPMSPLTRSWHSAWMMLDVSAGIGRETLASIGIAVSRRLGAHETFLRLAQNMAESKCSIYQVLGNNAEHVEMKEFYTDRVVTVRNPFGSQGTPGEIWYVRILPPNDMEPGVHVCFNTPYVMYQTSAAAWQQYFERQLENVDESKRLDEFRRHMKHGPEPFYWPEYVFYSYVNFRSDYIICKGLPDIPESLPCRDEYLSNRTW